MYELINAVGDSFYIDCPSKIGLVRLKDGGALMIDSGLDKDAGKRALAAIGSLGLKLEAIYNTHSHADHIGGNSFVHSKTGCRIFSPEYECDFIRHPIYEPAFLYGGYPPNDLRGKFLLAKPSPAEELSEDIPGIKAVDLAGHTPAMKGYLTDDGALYLADALSSIATLEKYGVGVIYDVQTYLDTLERVKCMNAEIFIPSHADPTDDILPLAQYNIDKVNEVATRILDIIKEPLPFDTVLARLFESYGLSLNLQQYAMVGSTLRSYLAWHLDGGRAAYEAEGGYILWRRA